MKSTQQIFLVSPMRKEGASGVQAYVNSLHDYLIRNGIAATIITPSSFSPFVVFPVFAIRMGLEAIVSSWGVGWGRYWRYYFIKRVLKQKLKKQEIAGIPTVIYAQCPLSAKAALEARKTANQKVFLIVHYNISQADEWADKGKIKLNGKLYKGIKSLEEALIPHLDGIVYVSQFMKETIEKSIPQAKSIQSVFLPCFTDKPQSAGSKYPKRDLINIGTLESRKNQIYLLRILACAKKKGHPYSLTLVGEGPERGNLENLAQSLGISDQVAFLGYQKNAAQLLGNHRIYVHSAFIENLPIALLEALSHNLPIVAGAVGGIPEIFDDGVEGFYWPLDDPETAAEILIRLIESQEIYHSVVQATRRRFYNQFHTDKVASQVVLFLRA